MPCHPGQTPLSHACEPTGRPDLGRFTKFRTGWLDLPNGPGQIDGLYPFGHGLSYTRFAYGAPQATRREATGDADRLSVWIDVKNAGRRAGVETVQLYLSDPVARATP
ncbi:MAG: hypothetical protein CVU63_02350 [Deltaproteobacteria bacterium HGW-Deltaproteobacteria-20]|nr:MAG: hypothetical protein CVU63_02350 [Deltaproteobacteria bacterium HGW-Deltaproteobacteria-20]